MIHFSGIGQRHTMTRWCAGTIAAWICMLFVVAFPQDAGATHLVGGDLRYRCLGNNQYEIRLTYRRDCLLGAPGTEFEPLASIGFFNALNNAPLLHIGINGMIRIPFNPDDTINQILISDCTIAGNDVCVHQTTYIDTITLPPFQPGYKIVYQRCCRNQTLQNVFDPLNTGMTLVAELSFAAQQACNTSPKLEEYPPIYICVNRPIDWLFDVSDVDGDSLIFELFTPFLGASDNAPQPSPPPPPPYTPITWNPPYNLNNLLGGDALVIDRFTGQITGTPNLIGQFLVGVKVFSYRNGQLIETTTWEWQYNIRACRDVPIADILASTDLNCDGFSIDFMQNAVFADEYFWIFDYDNAGSETSTDPNPTYVFPVPGFYDVALIVNDADSICFDTAILRVGVFESDLTALFFVDVPTCDETIVVHVTDASDDPDPAYDIVSWEYVLTYDTVQLTSSAQNPQWIFDEAISGINLVLTVTSSNGCTATYDTTFDVNIIVIPLKGDTVGVCAGDSVALFHAPGGPFTYIWDPVDFLDLSDPQNPIAFPPFDILYHLTVTDGLCEVTASVQVVVTEVPVVNFEPFTDCRSLVVTMNNTSTGGFNYHWDFGDGNTSIDDDPIHTYDAPGIYTITLSSNDGCSASISKDVIVSIIDEEVEDETTACFAGPIILNPGGSDLYGYDWEPEEFLDDPNSPSPVAHVSMTTTFRVTITDSLGCFVIEDVLVLVPPDFEFGAPADTTYCDTPGIVLNGTNPNVDYTWWDLEGNLLHTGPVFIAAPDTQTSYLVIGTDVFGCEKSDTITLTPTVFNIEVGPDVVICLGEDTVIYVVNLDTTQNLVFDWMPKGSIIGPSDIPNPRVMPLRDQIYTVQITNTDVGCVTTETVWVGVSVFQIEFAPSLLICLGECIQLGVPNLDTTNLMYSWTPTESIQSGADTPFPVVCPTETTTYTAVIKNLDYGCETTIEIIVNVSWFDPDFLEIYVDPDTVIILNAGEFHISTNQDPSHQFMWSGPDINNPTAPEITITPSADGSFVVGVTVTNADGCQLIGSTGRLTVIDPACTDETVFIPQAFSPNGDGFNDDLRVYSNIIQEIELRIYNRWGEEVFVTFDQNIAWDGTFKGKDCPAGVFGYYMRVVCIPNKPFFKKGNITLFR